MKALCALLLLACSLHAQARLPVSVPDSEQWRVQGSGEMRWFGLSIYNARLWRSGERWQSDLPYALELTYRRSITSAQLVDSSIDEIVRLGEKDEQKLKAWRLALAKIFPAVRDGDVILGLHEPGRGARFFFNGAQVGQLNDPQLAAAFFSIWLDPRTREPELRARLLAETGSNVVKN